MEIEIKLGPADPTLAAEIFDNIHLLPYAGGEEQISMRTVYYDDPDGSFSARKQTLRLRQENHRSVCTFKTALKGLARVELECEAPDIATGAAALASLPAMPEDARKALLGGLFTPKCSARFLRRTRLCRVEDTLFHLCLDQGVLEKGSLSVPMCELELELVEGELSTLQAVAHRLMNHYNLPLCVKSKQQRAMELGRIDL